jgi:hypothetical protein
VKRVLGIGALLAALAAMAVPASAVHQPNHDPGLRGAHGKRVGHSHARGLAVRLAVRECRAERRSLGRETFRAKYGEHAFRTCVRQSLPDAREAVRNAARECRAEREEIGVEAFREKYGSNRNKRNAFGKCVSQHARADHQNSSSG